MLMSLAMRKPAFCICENKDADQLRGYREADQRLCFRNRDSTIPLLPKSEISSFQPSCVVVKPGLCRTWSETPKTGFLTTRLTCPMFTANSSSEIFSEILFDKIYRGCWQLARVNYSLCTG